MNTRSYRLYRYQIPMDSQVVLRNRFLKVREGLLVQLKSGQREGWGEIAPLPEFSVENISEAQQQVVSLLDIWQSGDELDFTLCFPSVAFGVSCALAELNQTLTETGNYGSAPLCYGDPDELYDRLNAMQGEKIAKIKVGLYEANRDGLIADMFLEAIPDLKLRLDANRAWTLEKAMTFAKYVKPQHRDRIQFIEEPCRTPELSRIFAQQTGIALAWDETVREPHFDVKKEAHLAAIVIKPTLVGSLQRCIDLIQQAHQQGIRAVISSSIESSFGLTQLARIAQQYTPQTLPGLDTLDLMQFQLIRQWQGSQLPLITLESDYLQQII